MTWEHPVLTVASLCDSRGLDTYYLSEKYPAHYGVNRVFTACLDAKLKSRSPVPAEAVLVPDHFRAGSVESNILRLALCDPDFVIICDGIWETLLNREKFFAEAGDLGVLKASDFGSDDPEIMARSADALQKLYFEDRLSISPQKYEARLARIAGYFARRRRTVIWLSMVVPPRDFKGGVHYAGNYRPLAGWHRRLEAINAVARNVMDAFDGIYVDLDAMVERAGGFEGALLDQWHFTEAFHRMVGEALGDEILGRVSHRSDVLGEEHVSRKLIIPGRRQADVNCVAMDEPRGGVDGDHLGELRDAALVFARNDQMPDQAVYAVLKGCDASVVAVYDDELGDGSV